MCAPGRAHMEKHYADLKKKPFFKDLVDYMISGPVVCMVWEGLGAVKCGRMMLGETNPQASLPGSIRGDMSIQVFQIFCEHESINRSDATFATAQTLLSPPRLKLLCGSRRRNSSTGARLHTAGSMKTEDLKFFHLAAMMILVQINRDRRTFINPYYQSQKKAPQLLHQVPFQQWLKLSWRSLIAIWLISLTLRAILFHKTTFSSFHASNPSQPD